MLPVVKADIYIGNVPAGTSPVAVAVNQVTNKIYVANGVDGNVVFNPLGSPYRWNIITSRLEQTSGEPPIFLPLVGFKPFLG